jgi:TM2 domain-containing membrane protein YozV
MTMSKKDLTLDQLILLQSELKHAEKSLALAYLMLIGGHLGVHRFYLRRPVSGSFQLALFVIFFIFYLLFSFDSGLRNNDHFSYTFLVPTLVSGIALGIWVMVDMFIIPRIVREWNSHQEQLIIERIVRLPL